MTAYCSSNRQSYVVKVGLTNGDGKRRSRPLRVIYEVTLVAPDSTPLGTFINTAVILIGVDYPGEGWVLALVPSLGGQQQAISFHKHESVNMSKLGSIACGNTSWELFYGNTVHPSLYRLSIEVSRRGETIAECRWVSGCMALLLAIHHRVGKCSPANLLPLPLFQQIFMIFADYYHSGIRIVCQDGIDRLVLTEASLSANQHILAKMFLTNRLPPSPLKELLPQLEIGDPVGDAYPNLKQALFEHNATLRIGHSTNQSTALDVTQNGASLLDTCVSIIDMTMDIDHTLCDVDQDLSYWYHKESTDTLFAFAGRFPHIHNWIKTQGHTNYIHILVLSSDKCEHQTTEWPCMTVLFSINSEPNKPTNAVHCHTLTDAFSSIDQYFSHPA